MRAPAAWLHHFASNFCAPWQQSPCVCLLSARDPTPSIDRETEWRMKRERLLYEGVQLKINAHKTASMSRGGDKAPVTGSYLAVHWASGKKAKKPEGWEKRWALSVNWLFCSALSSSFSLFGECLITGLEDSERVTVLDDIQEQEHTSTHTDTHKHTTHTYTCKLTLFFNLEVWICKKATQRPNHNRSQVLTSSIHTHTHTDSYKSIGPRVQNPALSLYAQLTFSLPLCDR